VPDGILWTAPTTAPTPELSAYGARG